MAKYKIIPSSRTIVQSPISVGHRAEKGVEAIEFDLTAWVETYGSGTLTVIMRRWGDAIPYPIALEIDENNKATWTLSDIDTAKAGMAYAQLSYIVGETVVKKSDIYTFRVMDSLTGEGEPPEAYESWLEHLQHLAAEAMAEVLDIEGIVTDKTLTIDGGIADAKATGEALAEKVDAADYSALSDRVGRNTIALAEKADQATTYTKAQVDTLIESVDVETDTTLSVSGKPADAAETGRQIGLLKADLEAQEAGTLDFLSMLTWNADPYRLGFRYSASVPVGTVFVLSNTDYLIELNDAPTSGAPTTWKTAVITTAEKPYVVFRKADNTPINEMTDVEINACFSEIGFVTETQKKIDALENDVESVSENVSNIVVNYKSANRMNIDADLTKHYVVWQQGALISTGTSHYFVSQPIPIKNGDVVRRNVDASVNIQFGAYVDAEGNGLERIPDKGSEITTDRDGYISVNFNGTHLLDAMVTINEDMPEEFVRYENETKLSNNIHLNDVQIADIGASSPLTDKLIAYNGDSICESRISENPSANGGAYAKLIADIVKGTYENRGVSGGILASAVPSGTLPARCVVSDVQNMTENADLVCFEGGINDYWRNVPLGDFSESDYTGELDTTTVCGALESIFRQAKIRWNGKPIVFIIVHKITSTVYSPNSAGYTFAQERAKMIGICEKYAIPYYDAFAKSGLNAYVSVQNTAYLTSNANGTPDGCHPNAEGYKRYYVPQLIKLFESVMPN